MNILNNISFDGIVNNVRVKNGLSTKSGLSNDVDRNAVADSLGELTDMVKKSDVMGIDRLLKSKFAGVHPRTVEWKHKFCFWKWPWVPK